ncbi:MAG: hypothetical protein OEY81_01120 [Candidatus Bathyarchaeota archaeon]|nr:hypothetical protein [Candidatus Bathyarchaeota archaeon]
MKRWKTILGRGGTTLIVISLALLLVSIIPQLQISGVEGYVPLLPEQVQIAFDSQNLNPQQEVELAVTVEGTLKVYLLEISVEFQFVNGTFDYGFNLTDLQELLEEHPDQIIWKDQVENGNYERSYTPTRIMNATVVFYNPSSEIAYVEYDVTLKSGLAPGDKVRTIAYCAAPIGIILAIPWLLNSWKQRKHK